MPPFFREKGEGEMEQQITLRPAQVELAEEAAEYYRRNRLFLAPFEPPRPEEFFTPEHQRTILEQEVRAWEAKPDTASTSACRRSRSGSSASSA